MTNDDALQPNMTQKDFTTSNDSKVYNRPGYNLHVFDIRYHEIFVILQPIKVEFEFSTTTDDAVGLS